MAGQTEVGTAGQFPHGGLTEEAALRNAVGFGRSWTNYCGKCGGLIGESGKAYGYAGKWCNCPSTLGSTDEEIRRAIERKLADNAEQTRRVAQADEKLPKLPPITALGAPLEPPMTPSEFVAWMRGFFSGRTTPTDEKLEAVLCAALRRVR